MTAKTVCDTLLFANYTEDPTDPLIALKSDGTPLRLLDVLDLNEASNSSVEKLKKQIDKSGLFADNKPTLYFTICGKACKSGNKCATHGKDLTDELKEYININGQSITLSGINDNDLREVKTKQESYHARICLNFGRRFTYLYEKFGTANAPNCYFWNYIITQEGFNGCKITPLLTDEQKDALKSVSVAVNVKAKKITVACPERIRKSAEEKTVKKTVKKSVSEDDKDKDKQIAELKAQIAELKKLLPTNDYSSLIQPTENEKDESQDNEIRFYDENLKVWIDETTYLYFPTEHDKDALGTVVNGVKKPFKSKPQPVPQPVPEPIPEPVPEPIPEPEPLPQKEWKEFEGFERNGNNPVKGFLLEDEDGCILFYADKNEDGQALGALGGDKIELFEEGYKHFNIQRKVKKVVKK